MNGDKFTRKQDHAINYFLSGETRAEAYKKAYDCDNMKQATIHKRASELFEVPKIAARVEKERKKALQRTHTTLEEVLSLMANALRVDPLDAFDDNGSLKPLADMPKDLRLAITEFEAREVSAGLFSASMDAVTKVKFVSKGQLMEMFMKKFGAYAAQKLQVEDMAPTSSKITPEEISEIDKGLENEY